MTQNQDTGEEFPGGVAGEGPGIIAVAQVASVVRVQSLAPQLLPAVGAAKKKINKKKKLGTY